VSLAFVMPAALFGPASTAAASLRPTQANALPTDATSVKIDMQEADGAFTIANAADTGANVDYPGGSAAAIMFQPTATAQVFSIFSGSSCSGPWSLVGTATDPTASASDNNGLLNLCTVNGTVQVHGTLTALQNSAGAQRTVNTLPLEQYVADTVPGESPSSWASLGGSGPQNADWGFQELEAQAIAVRSYVLSNLGGYGGYADTCDEFCQTYAGTKYETPTSILAANDTAGQVMVMPNGSIATTEYSSSTGGYTSSAASGQSPFTPVADDGDAVSGNPNHHWTTSVSYATINSTWPQIGSFNGIVSATADPGHPDDFCCGRVDTITLNGSSGSVTIPGTEFSGNLGLLSDLFSITSTSGGTLSIAGQGWGHGIGMGQWGALGYAIGQDNGEGNWTFSQIVNHYYGPATLQTLGDITQVGGPSGGVGGYWINATDGGIFSFGNAQFFGSTGGMRLNKPVVGMASTHDAGGYWEVASDGGVFSFGDAHFWGSTGSIVLNKPMVGMAVTPGGGGYWLVASDGGIFAYGNAQFYGSTGSIRLNKPIVGMVPTHDGGGYWLVASDGGIFAYGDAGFFGSLGSTPPPTPIVGVAPSPDGGGYWMLEANGTVHGFGDAPTVGVASGSPSPSGMTSPMSAMIPDYSGQGFVAVDGSGQAFAFGDAPYFGDVTTAVPGYTGHAVGIAATPG
jgi:SpoIID/LytB domain protein